MTIATPVPLTREDIDAAADILVRSFAEDPGLLFVLPERANRDRFGPSLARSMVRFILACGAPLATAPPVRGVALWIPPDAEPASTAHLVESGLVEVPGQIGPDAWARLQLLMTHLDACHPQFAPEPHWYLTMLGVDPAWQRQGIGEALMRPVFDQADQDGIPCYLEAPTKDNALYYQRRGFRVVGEADIPTSDVHIWFMHREPA
jgi:ribosomal protein S18 acetylase RimI-like enzyme